MKINFKLGENAVMPTHSGSDAGYDIYAAENIKIPSLERALIKTNIQWEPVLEMSDYTYFNTLRLGVYADVRDRSGNALKKGLTVLGGIIDRDYRGIIGVILFNTDKNPVDIKIGDKIAQLIFTPCFLPQLEEVKETGETERGEKGFGSSGVAGS